MSATTVAGYGQISAGKLVVPNEIKFMGATGNDTLHHTIELENTAMSRTFKYKLPNITDTQVDGIDGLAVDSSVTQARILISGVANVDEEEIVDGAVTEGKIDEGAVSHAKLATDAVESDNIKDENVTHAKLAEDAVESDNIKNEAVTHAKLATNAVEEDNIKDGAVSDDKIVGVSASKVDGYGEFDGSDIEVRAADGTKHWRIRLDSSNNLEFAYYNSTSEAYEVKQVFESS